MPPSILTSGQPPSDPLSVPDTFSSFPLWNTILNSLPLERPPRLLAPTPSATILLEQVFLVVLFDCCYSVNMKITFIANNLYIDGPVCLPTECKLLMEKSISMLVFTLYEDSSMVLSTKWVFRVDNMSKMNECMNYWTNEYLHLSSDNHVLFLIHIHN